MSKELDEALIYSATDILNQELRVNGPIEVEQYKPSQIREGIKKLVDYLRAKIDRKDSTIRAQEDEIAGLKKIASTYLAQQSDFAHDSAENFRRAEFAEKRADSNFEDLEVVRDRSKAEFSKYIEAMKEYHLRAEQAESSLAAMTKERDSLKNLECPSCGTNSRGQQLHIFKNLTDSLAAERAKVAELRAMLEEAKSQIEIAYRDGWIKRAEAAEAKVAALEKDLGRAREAISDARVELHCSPDWNRVQTSVRKLGAALDKLSEEKL